ncbi:S41 family peptidase [Aquimarina longa]|uniref:S41 family peptidase n=1 Tax=Aquimarina longa TaxID=1080221 RepID=UPI000783E94C|nr:S41 family peptidase [Aquimarina longa]
MIKKVIICSVLTLLISCSSIKKHNQQIEKLHNADEIHEDIDYAYHKLQRLHPDLYWYISKDSLDKKINALKAIIQKPISSIEFYKQLSPVIASIRQGHTAIYPPYKKQTKKEKREKGKRSFSFKPLSFQRSGDRLFIKKNYGKDSTLIAGTELLTIEGEKVSDLLNYFKELPTGDGYNTTFVPEYVSRGFGYFYTKTHPRKDSLSITVKTRDKIYTHYLCASYSKQKKKSKKEKDTVRITKEKPNKLEIKNRKQQEKITRKEHKKRGFNAYKKEYNRNFRFIRSDSASTVAYMHIRSFTKGNFKKFYKESFSKIDAANCENLIIDLRDNLGGRISEIDELYSYLTDKEYVFIENAKMTKRLSFLYPFFHSDSWLEKTVATLFSPIVMTYQMFKVKKENGAPHYKFKYSKLRKNKENFYKGKIYVLINGMSFSASSILSTHLKANKRAIFVGEETGGAYNGTIAGIFTKLELPNSKVKMRVGLMKINTPYTKQPDGYGIMPDVYVKNNTEKDTALEWILQDVNKLHNKNL